MRTPPDQQHRWIPPIAPLLTDRWDAAGFVFGFQEQGAWPLLAHLGTQIDEGERVSSLEAAGLGFYRPSSIAGLMLHDRNFPPIPSPWEASAQVGPGDVVLSKVLPVAAAWVCPSTPRRPIDANCVRILGLPGAQGLWIAQLLEHPRVQRALSRLAAAAAIPRIGLRDLRALQLPEPPPELEKLAEEWMQLSAALYSVQAELGALQTEVNSWIEWEAPPAPRALLPRFFSAASVNDAWMPARLALRSYQLQADRRGGLRLGELLSEDAARLRGHRIEALRVLRLSDADGAFGFREPGLAQLKLPSFRIYAAPLEAEEVLLSVLGSAPKVVFHHPARPATVWLSDHWARFEPQGAPGALALLLRSPVVAGQLALATTGSARQFVPRAELLELRIPWPERHRCDDWHMRLSAVLEELHAVECRLDRLRCQMRELSDDYLGVYG